MKPWPNESGLSGRSRRSRRSTPVKDRDRDSKIPAQRKSHHQKMAFAQTGVMAQTLLERLRRKKKRQDSRDLKEGDRKGDERQGREAKKGKKAEPIRAKGEPITIQKKRYIRPSRAERVIQRDSKGQPLYLNKNKGGGLKKGPGWQWLQSSYEFITVPHNADFRLTAPPVRPQCPKKPVHLLRTSCGRLYDTIEDKQYKSDIKPQIRAGRAAEIKIDEPKDGEFIYPHKYSFTDNVGTRFANENSIDLDPRFDKEEYRQRVCTKLSQSYQKAWEREIEAYIPQYTEYCLKLRLWETTAVRLAAAYKNTLWPLGQQFTDTELTKMRKIKVSEACHNVLGDVVLEKAMGQHGTDMVLDAAGAAIQADVDSINVTLEDDLSDASSIDI